jgi:uncharacterized protein with GYD domain
MALGADDLVDLGLHQLMQHAEPDPDTQRKQSFLRGAREVAERLQHRGPEPVDALLSGRDRRSRYGPHGGWSSVLVDFDSHSPRSQHDRTRREDRRLKFYDLRDKPLYFAFGDRDAFAIVDLPDNESAAAVALTVNGACGATARTVVLLTPEEVDAAAERSVDYRAPGT